MLGAVAPVMVQPSCVQAPSIAVNVVSLVREIRNKPAWDSTRAAPPTVASGVPATVTCTREFANWLGTTLSIEAGPLGDVGDEPSPPQAVTSVANVAQEATWQAPAQNWRLVTGTQVWASRLSRGVRQGRVGNIKATGKSGFSRSRQLPREFSSITNSGEGVRNL